MKHLSCKLLNHFSLSKKEKENENALDEVIDDDEDFENNLQFYFEYESDEDKIEFNDETEKNEKNTTNRIDLFKNADFNESFNSLTNVYSLGALTRRENFKEEKY